MKNLFLGAFMLAFTAFATAQTDNTTKTTTATTTTATAQPATAQPAVTTQPTATATTTQATPAAAAQASSAAATAAADQGDYSKIQQSEIAPPVLKEAVAKYKDYALVEALIAEDGSNYKLVLTKDGKDVAAYYKSTGEFIREETV